ncbi:hypothetical protein BST81_01660 [Leptolyngbya sp. 'hensonii']|nr:hypothetical protein BST81_01660 [Leptolyngbya sp. 'hensonii']
MLILGVGVGVIVGSLLSAWDPATRATAGSSQAGFFPSSPTRTQPTVSSPIVSTPVELKLGEELTALKTEVQALTAQNSGLTAGVFFVDLDTGAYIDLNGDSTFSAASMIKVPILVAFLQDVDAGKIRLDEMLTMRPDLIGSGSGVIQYRTPGTQFTALEIATKMIVISDNTATNMLIDRLGGIAALNQRFQSWGLTGTLVYNLLPDLEGTNVTRPKELATLMFRVSQGDLLSIRSRDRMLDIMRRTETDTLLPRGLDDNATISHKTGDIGSMVGDVGVIDAPNGKRYVAVAMVKRPHNDSRAQEMIRRISRAAYQAYNPPVAPAKPVRSPSL